MTALQAEFTQLLRERKQRIDELLLAIGKTEDADGILKELTAVVHKLSGSSAMYGYAALGKIARECQQRFLQEGQRLTSDHEVLNRILGGLLEAMRESIETGPDATFCHPVPRGPHLMDHREQSGYTTAELEALAQKGVRIPAPHQVYIARDVPLDAIAPGVTLLPFTRLGGAATRIDTGAVIGAAGAATLDDCWIGKEAVVGALGPVTLNGVAVGPGTVLGCGVAEQAVFLGKETGDPDFSTGFGFRVRRGSLYEEDANSAQHTDTKMTILFPWVTLGSNLNWCDILVAGGSGTGAGRFSEVGSGAIHFNFTPRGDKATGSLLGNVVDGVFLNQERLFIGGHASLVGPLNASFGAITGAGCRFHRNLRRGLNLAAPPSEEAESGSFDMEIYGSIYRIYTYQIEVVGQLCALDAWYGQVRGRLAADDPDRSALYARGREIVRMNVSERIAQLGALAGRMDRSVALLRQEGDEDPRIRQHRALLEHWPTIEAHLVSAWGRAAEAPPALMAALEESAALADGRYTKAIQALPSAAAGEGREWLRGIVADVASEHILTLISPLGRSY